MTPVRRPVPLSFSTLSITSTQPRQKSKQISGSQVAMAGDELDLRPPVLLLRSRPSPYDAALSDHFHLLKSYESHLPKPLFLSLHAASARALLASGLSRVDAETVAALPRLEFVMTTSAGVDHIDLAECARKGIRVANAGNVFSADAADYAVGLLIDVLRRVSAGDRIVRGGLWPVKKGKLPLGFKLGGKRIGIVGLGSIGSEIAKRLEPFGCIISYNSRQKKPSVPYPYYSNVHDLAAASDVLIVCCALNNETHHIINKDVMGALGKKGFVINVGRGSLVDEKELVQHLMRGEIGGAGLDVFENEPTVPEEFHNMDNVVLSPHRAVLTTESFHGLRDLIVGNLKAFFSDKPLLSPVSLPSES